MLSEGLLFVAAPSPLAELLETKLGEARAKGGKRNLSVLRRSPQQILAGDLPEAECKALVFLPAVPLEAGAEPDPAHAARVTREVLAASPGLRTFVLLSTAAITSPSYTHPGQVPETAAAKLRTENPVAQIWAQLEIAVEAEGHPAAAGSSRPRPHLVFLRPAPTPVPGGRDLWSRLLGLGLRPRRGAPVLAGHDPTVQLLAVTDLAEAILAVLPLDRNEAEIRTGPRIYHVAPRASAPLRRVLRAAGRRPRTWPRSFHALLRRPLDLLEYLRYPWTVSGRALEEDRGFRAQRSTLEVAGAPPGAEPDPFGLDADYIRRWSRGPFRALHDGYWRIEVAGLSHVPLQGPAILLGIHRGFMPFDGVMLLHLLERRLGRIPRFLIHPALAKFPFLSDFHLKLGGLVAHQRNGAWVLAQGELLGIFPEGIRGAFSLYRDAYRLKRFGRDQYLRMALRHGVPILPFITVGSAEAYPILARLDWAWWRRLTRWPFFPITPTWPWIPLPLPSKWHTRILAPIDLGHLGPEAADDPALVRRESRKIQQLMAETLEQMRRARPSIFFGRIFDAEPRH